MGNNNPIYEGANLTMAPPCAAKLEQFLKQVNPSQEIILRSKSKEFLGGGGFGSGKTSAFVVKGIMLCQYFPGTTGFVARETYVQLKDTVLETWKEWCPKEWGRYVKTDGPGGTYYFNNGSKVIFRHFDKFSAEDIKSLNLGWAFIDQGEDVPEATYKVLLSRLRQMTLPKTQVFLSANPRPGWLKRHFIDPWMRGELPPEREVINTPTDENAHNLPSDYMDFLKESYSDVWYSRYVEAKWDAFEGLVYPDFSRNRHVIKREQIPINSRAWPMTMVLDYGLRNPTHANAYITSPNDHHYHVGEYRADGLSVPEYAQGIIKKFGHWMPFQNGMWADPSIKARTEKDRPTIQELFGNAGLPMVLANNDFESGYAMVTRWLKEDRLHVVEDCRETIQEFEEWEWEDWTHLDDRNKKERPKDRNNHSMDDYTYFANLHPSTTKKRYTEVMQTEKQIIEAENVPEIDPQVVEQARSDQARKHFKTKHRRPFIY